MRVTKFRDFTFFAICSKISRKLRIKRSPPENYEKKPKDLNSFATPADVSDDKSEAGRSNLGKKGLRSAGTDYKSTTDDDEGRESELPQPDADLLRMFAEIRFIHGEVTPYARQVGLFDLCLLLIKIITLRFT